MVLHDPTNVMDIWLRFEVKLASLRINAQLGSNSRLLFHCMCPLFKDKEGSQLQLIWNWKHSSLTTSYLNLKTQCTNDCYPSSLVAVTPPCLALALWSLSWIVPRFIIVGHLVWACEDDSSSMKWARFLTLCYSRTKEDTPMEILKFLLHTSP